LIDPGGIQADEVIEVFFVCRLLISQCYGRQKLQTVDLPYIFRRDVFSTPDVQGFGKTKGKSLPGKNILMPVKIGGFVIEFSPKNEEPFFQVKIGQAGNVQDIGSGLQPLPVRKFTDGP